MEEKFERFKLIKKSEFNESNFIKVESSARIAIDKATDNDLLVLTLTNNSPTLTVKAAEPYTKDVFEKIITH
jgi:hypothetical protein